MIICFGGEPTAKIIHSKPGPLQVCLKNINAKLSYGLLASRLRAASHVMKSVLQHEKILLTCCDSAVKFSSKTQVAVRFQSGLTLSWVDITLPLSVQSTQRRYFAIFNVIVCKTKICFSK